LPTICAVLSVVQRDDDISDWDHERDYRRSKESAAFIFRVECSFTPMKLHGVIAQKTTIHIFTSGMARFLFFQYVLYKYYIK
jgi:hypothetical protein